MAAAAATLEDLTTRLAEAARVANDATDTARQERERRDRLVVAALREGMSYRKITEVTGLSRTRIIAIVANNG